MASNMKSWLGNYATPAAQFNNQSNSWVPQYSANAGAPTIGAASMGAASMGAPTQFMPQQPMTGANFMAAAQNYGQQPNYQYQQPVGAWKPGAFTGPFGTPNPFGSMPYDPSDLNTWKSNQRGNMESWIGNWLLPILGEQQDWAKFVQNDKNWQNQFAETQRMNTYQMGMTDKEFAEKLRLAGVSEEQWMQTFGENQRQWNQQHRLNQQTADRQYGLDDRGMSLQERANRQKYGLDNRTLQQNVKEQNRRFGLDSKTLSLDAQEKARRFGLDKRESRFERKMDTKRFKQDDRAMAQEKKLTRERMRSDELQGRYQAFGRAQEPGQATWSKNWG